MAPQNETRPLGAAGRVTLADRIAQMGPTFAVVERVAPMPGQGVSSTFKFGASYGAVLGILGALKIRTALVIPTTWKKHFRLPAGKEGLRAWALRTFSATSQHFARKKDHGRAEAAFPSPTESFGLDCPLGLTRSRTVRNCG
jgi:hypothetical protein